MNDFFTNLVDRHLGTCNTIQPRTPGRFEEVRDEVTVSPNKGMNRFGSEIDQTLQVPPQPLSNVSHELPEETASEINLQEPIVDECDHPVGQRGPFSVDAPKVTIHEIDSIGGKKNSSSDIHEENDYSAQFNLTEQPAVLLNPPDLNIKKNDMQQLGTDSNSYPETTDQEQHHQQTQVKNISLVAEKNIAFSSGPVQIKSHESHEKIRDNHSLLSSPAGEHTLENDLNQRIHAMLQGLMTEPESSTTESIGDERNKRNNESPISISPEQRTPLRDAIISPQESPLSMKPESDRQDRSSIDDKKNIPLFAQYGQLETPSWLPEIETQFKQRLQETNPKPEPVINVTIGRVEVRAVKSENTKKVRSERGPDAVMNLDDYLKQRETRK